MGYPDLTFRTELDPVTRKELELYSAQLAGFLSGAGFKSDGSFEDARFDNATLDTATIDTATITTATIATATMTALLTQLLTCSGYGTYTATAGDTNALANSNDSPEYLVWRVSSSTHRTINGIACGASLTVGLPGQLLFWVNISGYTHTFESAVVTNARRIYGCVTPTPVEDGGMAAFLYDGVNLGWRYLCSTRLSRLASLGIGQAPSATSPLALTGLPTSAAGLATGDVWVDTTGGLNILKIV